MNNVETVTLFVEKLQEAKLFYTSVFEVEPVYEDDVSSVFQLDGLMINLLQGSEAPELVAPLLPGDKSSAPRMLLTSRVVDVDRICGELQRKGITLLNGPIDRPWG